MSPPPWATPAQLEFLNQRKADFKAAQKDKRLPVFWDSLHRDFFAMWDSPEAEAKSGVAIPEEGSKQKRKRSRAPKEESFRTIDEWIADRKHKLNNWFNNHGLGKKSRAKGPVIQLGSHLSNQPKRLQTELHIYSKKYFIERVKPGVDAECQEKGIDEHGRIAVVNRHLADHYANESEDVKEEIRTLRNAQEEAKQAARDAAISDIKQERTPEEYTNAIEYLPEVFEEFCKYIDQNSGWAVTLIAGGPDPLNGGKIRTIGYHSHKNKYGLSFGKASTSFQDSYLKPFSAFLHTVYSPDDMKRRAIGYVDEKQGAAEKSETPPLTTFNASSSTLEVEDVGLIQTNLAPLTSSTISLTRLEATDMNSRQESPVPAAKSPRSHNAENIPATLKEVSSTTDKRSDTMGGFVERVSPAEQRAPALTPHGQNVERYQTDYIPLPYITPSNPHLSSLGLFPHPSSPGQHLLDDLPTSHVTESQATSAPTPVDLSSNDTYGNITDPANSVDGLLWKSFGDMSDEQFEQLCSSTNVLDTPSHPSNFRFDFSLNPSFFDPLASFDRPLTNVCPAPLAPAPMNPEIPLGLDPVAPEKGLASENQSHRPPTLPAPEKGLASENQSHGPPALPAPEKGLALENQSHGPPALPVGLPLPKKGNAYEESVYEVERERAGRQRKPAASKEVVALTAQQAPIPDWLEAARHYLSEDIEDETWRACTEAWLLFEKENLLMSTAHRLPTAKLRPEELSRWLSSRKYQSIPFIPDLKAFADQWCRWWNSMQPQARQRDGPLLPISLSNLGDNVNISAIKRGGPNGLLTVLIGLKWWAIARVDDQRWLEAVTDIRECLECFGRAGTKRKAGSDEGTVTKKKKAVL